jgi:hypothetical protein
VGHDRRDDQRYCARTRHLADQNVGHRGDYTDTITSAVNGLVSDFIAIDNALGVVTATGANTALVNTAFSYLGQCMAASQAAGAASVVMSWHNTVNSPNNVQIISAIAPVVSSSAAVTGTGSAGVTGTQVRTDGTKTLVSTLTGDTFSATDATAKQAIIDSWVAATSPTWGWNAVRALIPTSAVVFTGNTVVTLTIPALVGFQSDSDLVLTQTIPGTILTGGVAIVAAPTVTIARTATNLAPVGTYSMAGTATNS